MYATCLFCNASLGANRAIEEFPVGRRLAFDAAGGRLWVVCRGCQRWNLSPLETRWEAIESAERLFRETRTRVSTDNIGLARVADRTELIRIGKPLRPEFAAWRYGDQMVRRRRAYNIGLACGITFGIASGVRYFVPGLSAAQVSWMGLVFPLMQFATSFHERRLRPKHRLQFARDDGSLLTFGRGLPMDTHIEVHPSTRELHVRFQARESELRWRDRLNPAVWTGLDRKRVGLTGETAARAVSAMLPFMNVSGATRGEVDTALQFATVGLHIDRPQTTLELVTAAYAPERRPEHHRAGPLALEMALHEADERRAMEGELAELEARWKDADTIAKIADGLLLPEGLDARVGAMKRHDTQRID